MPNVNSAGSYKVILILLVNFFCLNSSFAQNVGQAIEAQENLSSTIATTASARSVSDVAVPPDGAIGQLPSLNQPIIDQAKILSGTEQAALTQTIAHLYAQAQAQVGIVIVTSTGQETIFDYAMRVADAWQLGSKKNDNGLLVVVAINDRKVQILTGYGLEGVLPDIVLNHIIHQQMNPYFQQAQYAQGLVQALAEIQRILNLDPTLAAQAAQELQQRQQQALIEKQKRDNMISSVLMILLLGGMLSSMLGKRLTASVAGVAGVVAGLVNGMGVIASVLTGFVLFFLFITALAQMIFKILLSALARGRSSGGGRGGGSYRGGGGGFGGGGASGSW